MALCFSSPSSSTAYDLNTSSSLPVPPAHIHNSTSILPRLLKHRPHPRFSVATLHLDSRNSSTMSSQPSDLNALTRSKLSLSFTGKAGMPSCSLHRWVLLKNSIRSTKSPLNSTSSLVSHVSFDEEVVDVTLEDTEDVNSHEADSFMFPQTLPHPASMNASEAEWLDSLLVSLGEEEEDDEDSLHTPLAALDDDEDLLSPVGSPTSSSDDLSQPTYYSYPYPVPYPPFHPPLIRADHESMFGPSPFCNPHPDHDDDATEEDESVPDAIEDVSDDDSEAPSVPPLTQSLDSSASSDPTPSLLDSSSHPQVYIDRHDSYFDRFELDHPFPLQLPYDSYSEC